MKRVKVNLLNLGDVVIVVVPGINPEPRRGIIRALRDDFVLIDLGHLVNWFSRHYVTRG